MDRRARRKRTAYRLVRVRVIEGTGYLDWDM
jgi:hypothetical protein